MKLIKQKKKEHLGGKRKTMQTGADYYEKGRGLQVVDRGELRGIWNGGKMKQIILHQYRKEI
jgi:hypothetical protein